MKQLLTPLLIVFLLIGQFSAGAQEPKSFTFVQMTDTQLGFGGYEHDLQSFEQAVKQVNELKPDFVIICGDLVNIPGDTAYTDFKRIRKKFDVPCYCLPGNHDTYDSTTLASYRKVIGKDYYSFRHKGSSFIVANTQFWKTNFKGESEKFDNWFTGKITALGKKRGPLFVAGHIPLFVSEPGEAEEYYNIEPVKRKRILDLFTDNNVVAYLTGHAHKLVSNEYKGIRMVTCETTSVNFDKRPLGFRLWTVSPDSISNEFIPLAK